MKQKHPRDLTEDNMYQALLDKNPEFEGIFFVGVITTGIFCRPTCRARKPKRENVTFHFSTKEALANGYRPCKVCRPMEFKDEAPEWIKPLLEELGKNPGEKISDYDLISRGIEPNRVRRWFKKNHRMTFQAYQRLLRIGHAFGRIKHGEKVVDSAMDSGYESLSGFTESFKKELGYSPQGAVDKDLVRVTRLLTPLGPMLAGATGEGICLLEFVDRRMLETQLKRLKKHLRAAILPGHHRHFDLLDKQLKEYFNGTRKVFDLPLHLPATPFQQVVWKKLMDIPYGETRSYKQQAVAAGNPNAVRAVARANGDNRIGIIIPCHRVIGSNGELVGYGGGLHRKQYLLDLEQQFK